MTVCDDRRGKSGEWGYSSDIVQQTRQQVYRVSIQRCSSSSFLICLMMLSSFSPDLYAIDIHVAKIDGARYSAAPLELPSANVVVQEHWKKRIGQMCHFSLGLLE